MMKATTILLCTLFMLSSCRNAVGNSEKMSREVVNTQHLKNSPIAITDFPDDTPEAVKDFYGNHGNKTLWTNEKDRKALHSVIKDAVNDGLLPEDYSYNKLIKYENIIAITEAECIAYDVLLTESFRKLASHLHKGKLRPYNVHHDWALPGKSINANKLLNEALADNSVKETLEKCRPNNRTYASLRKGMAFLNSLPDDSDLKRIDISEPVKLKDSASVVGDIKARLAFWKDLDEADATGNIYDRKTMKAVKRFQKRHGVYPSGVVDKYTAQLLNTGLGKRKQQLIANLERWRWFPEDFGEKAFLINIPEFRMVVLEKGTDTIESYKVVVGKPGRRTPVLHSTLSNLVINPTWTVPPTILKEDLTPSASEDRSYFASHNMKIYKHRDTIETQPEEWDPEKANHYRYVQGPGTDNALGLVKFNFRNNFSVYLHDTNHRELFRKGYRALSSGCVRVQDPLKLAGYILDKEDAGWSKEKLDSMIAEGQTKNVGLKKGTHVHQLYWTAWMDHDGLQFRNDVYNLDKVLYKKLRQ